MIPFFWSTTISNLATLWLQKFHKNNLILYGNHCWIVPRKSFYLFIKGGFYQLIVSLKNIQAPRDTSTNPTSARLRCSQSTSTHTKKTLKKPLKRTQACIINHHQWQHLNCGKKYFNNDGPVLSSLSEKKKTTSTTKHNTVARSNMILGKLLTMVPRRLWCGTPPLPSTTSEDQT